MKKIEIEESFEEESPSSSVSSVSDSKQSEMKLKLDTLKVSSIETKGVQSSFKNAAKRRKSSIISITAYKNILMKNKKFSQKKKKNPFTDIWFIHKGFENK